MDVGQSLVFSTDTFSKWSRMLGFTNVMNSGKIIYVTVTVMILFIAAPILLYIICSIFTAFTLPLV